MKLLTLSQIYVQRGKVKEGLALFYQANPILQELNLPLSEIPYPQWCKFLIKFTQCGKLQLILYFILGVIAFPFALVGFILLFIWRWIRSLIK